MKAPRHPTPNAGKASKSGKPVSASRRRMMEKAKEQKAIKALAKLRDEGIIC